MNDEHRFLMEYQNELLERVAVALEKFHSDKAGAILNDVALMRLLDDAAFDEIMEALDGLESKVKTSSGYINKSPGVIRTGSITGESWQIGDHELDELEVEE